MVAIGFIVVIILLLALNENVRRTHETIKKQRKWRKYWTSGIIFSELTPDEEKQLTLFTDKIEKAEVPTTETKDWEMKSNYITRKYTTSWDELPLVHV
jgi:hypothetical protein